MKPPAFDYLVPTSVSESLSMLAEHGQDGKILAGGQSLVPILNLRLAHPSVLIDINRLSELSAVETNGNGLTIGGLVRQQQLLSDSNIAGRCPLLAEAGGFIAHKTIRNRGTVGGSIAHADPSAELPAALVALGATVNVQGPHGERSIPASDFFVDIFTTELQPDELLTSIQIPDAGDRTGMAFVEISRRHGDYALVGVAAVVRLDDSGAIADSRLVISGVASTPFDGDTSSLQGESPSEETLLGAARRAVENLDPFEDVHASAAYRRHVAETLSYRALASAVQRAEGGTSNA